MTRIYGQDTANHLVNVAIPPKRLIDIASFRAGDARNSPRFTVAAQKTARIGIFAARKRDVERAFIVLLPATGTPNKVLVGISHGFGQNAAYYASKGWRNPLSPDLIADVRDRFVIERWGPQMLAGRKQMAMVVPVRAQGSSELGPFGSDGAFARHVLQAIGSLTRAFTVAHVEAYTYSSGIHDLNRFLGAAGGHLSFTAVYNMDPAHVTTAARPRGAVVRQFASGQTGTPGPLFEFLPYARWSNEPFHARSRNNQFQYLHNFCLPNYTLHLGIETS